MANIPTLKTERLLLRPFVLEDAPNLQRLADDRAVADTYSEIPHPFELEMADTMIRSLQPAFDRGERLGLAIVLKSTNELIGAIGLEITKLHQSGEVGYFIGTTHWNRGYATEAVEAMVEYGFETLQLHRIQARHMSKNPASGRVLQKVGMKYEGTLRQSLLRFGNYNDALIYGIVRGERR